MIPRILHQAWVGPKPIPEREAQWCAEMKRMNPDWECRLHGNEVLERYQDDPYVKELISQGQPWAFVCDRIRCLLLRDDGGVWLDPDCRPIRPLSRLKDNLWDIPKVHFVFALRNPMRTGVQLHRGITLADNTFLASIPSSRMIERVLEAWTPQSIVVDGHLIGVQILSYIDTDVRVLNYRYFYDLEQTLTPDAIVSHDSHNGGTWMKEISDRKLKVA
jgi:hypothetical protein